MLWHMHIANQVVDLSSHPAFVFFASVIVIPPALFVAAVVCMFHRAASQAHIALGLGWPSYRKTEAAGSIDRVKDCRATTMRGL